jgi:hypothetical protein
MRDSNVANAAKESAQTEFPHSLHYVRTALYFAVERGVAWRDADPKEVMGWKYSSLSQWSETIEAWAETNPDLFPQAQEAREPKLDLDPQSQKEAKCGA